MEKEILFKIGDSVQVREGTLCPDDESVDISGWQGRIFEIDDNLVGIRWDSITLEQLPIEYIKASEAEGLAWTEMYLSEEELLPVEVRDTKQQADDKVEEMERKFPWITGNQEDKRIFEVIADTDDQLEAWKNHLLERVVFPFEAEVSEPQDKGPLECGDKLKVHRITEADEHYGILVKVTLGKKRFVFPLCELTVLDKKSSNYTSVKDYCVWFANS